MLKRKKIIVANWKMNPKTPDEARKIFSMTLRSARACSLVRTIVCPPFVYLPFFASRMKSVVALGVQDVFYENAGSYTGMISSGMAKSSGASYAIVGHSERRALGETDEVVARKLFAVEKAELSAILCVGEEVRNESGSHFVFLAEELRRSLARFKRKSFNKLIIAYEPVWAIGKTADDALKPSDFRETYIFIKKVLSDIFGHESATEIPILYGGSVEPENVEALFTLGGADGFLVGHASLSPTAFKEILTIANAV